MSNWCLKMGDLFLRQIDQSATSGEKLNDSSLELNRRIDPRVQPNFKVKSLSFISKILIFGEQIETILLALAASCIQIDANF